MLSLPGTNQCNKRAMSDLPLSCLTLVAVCAFPGWHQVESDLGDAWGRHAVMLAQSEQLMLEQESAGHCLLQQQCVTQYDRVCSCMSKKQLVAALNEGSTHGSMRKHAIAYTHAQELPHLTSDLSSGDDTWSGCKVYSTGLQPACVTPADLGYV